VSFHGCMGGIQVLSITYPYTVTISNINVKPHYIASIVQRK